MLDKRTELVSRAAMTTKLDRAVFDLECRLNELMEQRTRIWLELQDASPEHGEAALLEINFNDLEEKIGEVRGELARLDDDSDWRHQL